MTDAPPPITIRFTHRVRTPGLPLCYCANDEYAGSEAEERHRESGLVSSIEMLTRNAATGQEEWGFQRAHP